MRQSEGERLLQQQLRDARLFGGCEPEYRFSPPRLWRFDFAWPGLKLAVEVEGGTWSAGRHVRGKGYEKDLEKYNAAAMQGWLVLRFTTRQVKKDEYALQHIKRGVAKQRAKFRVRNYFRHLHESTRQ